MESVVELFLPLDSYPVGVSLQPYPDLTVSTERPVPVDGVHEVVVEGAERASLLDDLRTDPRIARAVVLETETDRTHLQLTWRCLDTPLVKLADQHDAALVGLSGTSDGWTVYIHFTAQANRLAFYDDCRDRGLPVGIRRIFAANELDGAGSIDVGAADNAVEKL